MSKFDRFDLTKALTFFMVVTAWLSAAVCSKWFGLAGNRVPHALRSEMCILVEDMRKDHEISEELITLCSEGE